ncbi:MAG: ATP-binding protein [Candidatus Omnitrophota bacterium]|jgi:anti-sigma regulatory factor (Ser/Thr protein kinase)
MISQVFEIQSHPENLKALRDQVRPYLAETRLPEDQAAAVLIALGEACTNAMRHAYGNAPDKPVRVTLEIEPDKVVLRIRDFGKKIVLADIPAPRLPPDKGGGLGIYFMKTMMDDVHYNTGHPEGNELILTKRVPQGA